MKKRRKGGSRKCDTFTGTVLRSKRPIFKKRPWFLPSSIPFLTARYLPDLGGMKKEGKTEKVIPEMEETDSQPVRRQQKVIPHSILNASFADLFSSMEIILIGKRSMFAVLTCTEFHVKWECLANISYVDARFHFLIDFCTMFNFV